MEIWCYMNQSIVWYHIVDAKLVLNLISDNNSDVIMLQETCLGHRWRQLTKINLENDD